MTWMTRYFYLCHLIMTWMTRVWSLFTQTSFIWTVINFFLIYIFIYIYIDIYRLFELVSNHSCFIPMSYCYSVYESDELKFNFFKSLYAHPVQKILRNSVVHDLILLIDWTYFDFKFIFDIHLIMNMWRSLWNRDFKLIEYNSATRVLK